MSRAPYVLLADPGLRSVTGHHFNAAIRLRRAAHELGLGTRVLAAGSVSAEVRRDTGAMPTFALNAYLRSSFGPQEFDRLARNTYFDLAAAVGLSRPALIVLPTCDQVLAKAVARYLEHFAPDARPGVVAWLLLPQDATNKPVAMTDDVLRAQAVEIRDGYGALTAAATGGLRVFCETEGMARLYGQFVDAPIGIAPSPSILDIWPEGGRASRNEATPNIVTVGHVNRGKGYDLLPAALEQVAASGVGARFFIHAGGAGTDPHYRGLLERLARSSADVVTSDEDLSGCAYAEILRSADLLLLPYDPVVYADRGSGVFNEAESLGIPTIAPADCSFATSAIAAGRCVAIPEHTAAAVAGAIIKAIRNLEALRAARRSSAGDRVEDILSNALRPGPPTDGAVHRPGRWPRWAVAILVSHYNFFLASLGRAWRRMRLGAGRRPV